MCKLRIGCISVQYRYKSCVIFSPNVQYMYMCKICTRLYLFPQCVIYAQDCTYFPNVQYMRKIVLISPTRNICARLYLFPQCAIYPQDLCKIVLISPMYNICARLYLLVQCAMYVQDCTYISPMLNICARLYLFFQCAIYAQDLHKITSTSLPNVQYTHKIAGIIGRNMSHITYLL